MIKSNNDRNTNSRVRSLTLSTGEVNKLQSKSKMNNNIEDKEKKVKKNYSTSIDNKINKENSNMDLSKRLVSSKKTIRKTSASSTGNTSKYLKISKRKHPALINESIIEKSKLTTMKSIIEEIYRKFSNQEMTVSNSNIEKINNWKKIFRDTFEKEKIIDFSSELFIPKSLNNTGSYVLKLEKFWVLWLEIIKKELNLTKLIFVVNNALAYLNDDKTLRNFFNTAVNFLKIGKKEINEYCKNNNIKINNTHIGQYDYVLDNACSFNKNSKNVVPVYESSGKNKKNSPQFMNLSNVKKYNNFNNIDNNENIFSSNEKSSAISIYDLIISTDSPAVVNERINLTDKKQLYEASYLTISETVHEETLNNQSNININGNQGNNTTNDNIESISLMQNEVENNNNTTSSRSSLFIIRSPDVGGKSNNFNERTYNNLNNNENQHFTLAKQNQIDTKSIVQDIENITTALQMEIDQLKSPEFSIDNCCKINNYNIYNNYNNANIPNIAEIEEICCRVHVPISIIISEEEVVPVSEPKNNNPEGSFNLIETKVIKNEEGNLVGEIKYTNDNITNNAVEKLDLISSSPQESIGKLSDDSFEKFLKKTAEKRGDNVEEFISYKIYTPRSSVNIDERNINPKNSQDGDADNICDLEEDKEINLSYQTNVIGSRVENLDEEKLKKKRKTTNTRGRSKSKSKSKTKSKSKSKSKVRSKSTAKKMNKKTK